jgi:hypothetical protein
MLKRIHVNRHNVAYNKKHTHDSDFEERMPFTVKTYKDNYKTDYVECLDHVRLVYQPDKPLPCGAVAWMETDGDVKVGFVDGLYTI